LLGLDRDENTIAFFRALLYSVTSVVKYQAKVVTSIGIDLVTEPGKAA
jgi:hypothetical protein